MLKRMLIMLALVGLFIAGIGAVKVSQIRRDIELAMRSAPPPPAVSTAVAAKERWQRSLGAIGSLRAVDGVTVSTDLAGIVSEIAFRSGSRVKKGDLLVRLDSREEEAQLRAAEARRDLARAELGRNRSLAASGTLSKSGWDTSETELRQAAAAVDEARALIARKTITAPFDGQVGIRQVDQGQYLNVGAPIASLQSVDPVRVQFSIPQQSLEHVSVGRKIQLTAAGLGDQTFPGEVTAIDSRLDESTRNLLVEGTVPNRGGVLRPGMFVKVSLLLEEEEVVSLPASAIHHAPYGDSVFVVREGLVREQFVKLGPGRGDRVPVLSGLDGGEEVVSAGVFRLRSAMAVVVNNKVQPRNELEPTPPNS